MERITKPARPYHNNHNYYNDNDNDSNYYLNKWELLCGGITKNIKINIIRKIIKNQQLDNEILDINNLINDIVNSIEHLEKKIINHMYLVKQNKMNINDKLNHTINTINQNLEEFRGLLSEKKLLIKKKEEIL